MSRIFANGEELTTLKYFLKNKSIKYSDQQFDMNDNFTGFKPFNGIVPKNAPSNTVLWGIAASFPLSENNYQNNWIQFIFDLNGLFMFRTYDGSTGKMTWSAWKQIGGVLSNLTHLYRPRKAVLA